MSEPKKSKKEWVCPPVTPLNKHVKYCVDERVVEIGGKLVYQKWIYEQSAFPCPMCGKTVDVLFMRLPLGVFRTCSWDGFTEMIHPRHPDTDDEIAYKAEERPINLDETWEVMERNHSTMPPFKPPWIPERRRGRKVEPPIPPASEEQ